MAFSCIVDILSSKVDSLSTPDGGIDEWRASAVAMAVDSQDYARVFDRSILRVPEDRAGSKNYDNNGR